MLIRYISFCLSFIMKKKVFFSKKSSDYSNVSVYKKKDKLESYKSSKRINNIYLQQNKRSNCKNCGKKISGFDFKVKKVKYKICQFCNHVNGYYNETKKFFKKIYVNKKGKNFTVGYKGNDFNKRVENIYLPKIIFLKKIIGKKKILDLGCGAGFFQSACEKENIKCLGIEVNETLVNYSKTKLNFNSVKLIKEDNINDFVRFHNYDCLSLINVLEHLLNPNEIFENFIKSKAKYMFINVPLFSLRVLLENAFKSFEFKVLGSSHTHLYTKESLEYLFKKNNLKIIGEWWYGLDFLDLGSIIKKEIKFNSNKSEFYFKKFFGNKIDKFQTVLDEEKLSSEVHYVLKK